MINSRKHSTLILVSVGLSLKNYYYRLFFVVYFQAPRSFILYTLHIHNQKNCFLFSLFACVLAWSLNCLFVCVFIFVFVCLLVCLFVCLFVFLFFLSVCLSVSACHSVSLSVCHSVCLSVCHSVCLSVCHSVCLFVCLFLL